MATKTGRFYYFGLSAGPSLGSRALLTTWAGRLATLAALVFLITVPTSVCSQTHFYQGKTITIVQGRGPGGTGDLRVRALVPFLLKYIPGNPTIVMEFMSGGGSRKAANHVFNSARPDGLTIGNFSAGMVSLAVLGESGIQYDIDKFIYLGTPDSAQHYIFITNRKSGLTSLEKLRAASGVRIGAQSVGHPVYIVGRLFAYYLGLKEPKFVTGYTGPEIDIALMGLVFTRNPPGWGLGDLTRWAVVQNDAA